MKYPFYFQSAVHDCVPTCVLALAKYMGVEVSLKELRTVLVTDPHRGTPIKNLLNLQGLFQVTLGKIVEIREIGNYLPFIAYLNTGHAVVVWEQSRDGAGYLVGDPSIGVVELSTEELFQQWDGIAAVLRTANAPTPTATGTFGWFGKSIREVKALRLKWRAMVPLSVVITLLGFVNSLYSLYFARYLGVFKQFLLFSLCYTCVSGVLNWLGNLLEAKITLRYAESLGWEIRDSLPKMDMKFYTIGDISTRYQDIIAVTGAVIGVCRDVPYTVVIFCASIYFLGKISLLLVVFVLAFLVLIMCMLDPFVKKIRYFTYHIKIKQSLITNRLQTFLSGAPDEVTGTWEQTVRAQYKQSLWGIPIHSIVGNSAVLPVVFVVMFLDWRSGGVMQYSQVLSAMMMMNYTVSAGHTLYARFVSWQTAEPSIHRLTDFLEIDRDEKSTVQDSASNVPNTREFFQHT